MASKISGIQNKYSNNLVASPNFSDLLKWNVQGTATAVEGGFVEVETDATLKQSIALSKSSDEGEQAAIYGISVSATTVVPQDAPHDESYGSITFIIRYSDGSDTSVCFYAIGGLSSTQMLKGKGLYHNYEFDVYESDDTYPTSVDIIINATSKCLFGNPSARMNYGVNIQEMVESVETPKNWLRNSSFETPDPNIQTGLKPLHWRGGGQISNAAAIYGEKCLTLTAGASLETEGTAFITPAELMIVSWYRKGGKVTIELINPDGSVIKSWETGSWPGDWLRQHMYIRDSDVKDTAFGIRFKSDHDTVYIDSVKVEESQTPDADTWQEGPSKWVPHVEDAMDAILLKMNKGMNKSLTSFRIGDYNCLNISGVNTTQDEYSRVEYDQNYLPSAYVNYKKKEELVGLRISLHEDYKDYYVTVIETDSEGNQTFYTKSDLPSLSSKSYPTDGGGTIRIVVSEVEYSKLTPDDDFEAYMVGFNSIDPLGGVEGGYSIEFGKGDGIGNTIVFNFEDEYNSIEAVTLGIIGVVDDHVTLSSTPIESNGLFSGVTVHVVGTLPEECEITIQAICYKSGKEA